jgi:SAM-dependent methyltransferase
VSHTSRTTNARETYDAFAPFYDRFNSRYKFRRWTGRLLEAAQRSGLRLADRQHLLDLGCGTGLSCIPMAEQGWAVVACDLSPEMIGKAVVKATAGIDYRVADMRDLPRFEEGPFDLVWAVNDTVNYLLFEGELEAALAGMKANLAADGRIVFDVNTSATYANFFAGEHVVPADGGVLRWKGKPAPRGTGGLHEAEVFDTDGVGHRHVQRHFTQATIAAAFQEVGLELCAVLGEFDGDLSDQLDETHHTKAVYVGRRP